MPNSPDPSPSAAASSGAQQRFESLVNCIDGIVWEADPATFRFTFVSAQAEHILGYRVEDWYADGFWAAHIHPQDRERAINYCVTQTRDGSNHAFEYRMLAADGRVVWLKDAVSVGVCAGQAVSLRGIMVDITELKCAEQALRLSATVFESSTEGIMITDADTRILKVNRAFSAITGYAADEVLGRTPAFLQSDRQDAAFYRAMWQSIAAHGHWSGEIWSRRKSGEVFIERLSVSRVDNDNGAVSNYIGIFSDISHARAAQN